MWTCPQCGEMHESQFDSCWKCAESAPVETLHAPTRSPEFDRPRPVKPFAYFVGRALQTFILASILGIAFLMIGGAPAIDAAQNGVLFGAGAALVVGLLWWVLFPYEREQASGEPGT